MLINTDNHLFDSDHLVAVDRISEDRLVVILDTRVLDLRGIEAQQAYCQLREQCTDLSGGK